MEHTLKLRMHVIIHLRFVLYTSYRTRNVWTTTIAADGGGRDGQERRFEPNVQYHHTCSYRWEPHPTSSCTMAREVNSRGTELARRCARLMSELALQTASRRVKATVRGSRGSGSSGERDCATSVRPVLHRSISHVAHATSVSSKS